LAYVLVVFALLYITVTPADSDRVLGVQGRYFIVIVPLLALMVAAFNPYALGERVRGGAAMVLAAISVLATVEAILRVDWKIGAG